MYIYIFNEGGETYFFRGEGGVLNILYGVVRPEVSTTFRSDRQKKFVGPPTIFFFCDHNFFSLLNAKKNKNKKNGPPKTTKIFFGPLPKNFLCCKKYFYRNIKKRLNSKKIVAPPFFFDPLQKKKIDPSPNKKKCKIFYKGLLGLTKNVSAVKLGQ